LAATFSARERSPFVLGEAREPSRGLLWRDCERPRGQLLIAWMLRYVVLRALAVAAIFAVVWLVPTRAFATIIPVCDGDAFSGVPTLGQTPAETPPVDCTPAQAPSEGEDVDPQVAAMCDARGATVLAPDRIHPETDARIDIGSCEGNPSLHGPMLGPSHNDGGPLASSFVMTQDAVLTNSLQIRPALFDELPSYLPVTGAPQAGFDIEIFHPPRS